MFDDRELRDRRDEVIGIHGAREHNLKNVSLTVPRGRFVVVTGVSGSGKSTLAFDLLFAEGQRRFLDSMNVYARQFVEQLSRPDVDLITGIPPTVSIEQRISRGGSLVRPLRRAAASLGKRLPPRTWERVGSALPGALRQFEFSTRIYKLLEIMACATPEEMYRVLTSLWTQPSTLVLAGSEPPTIFTARESWPDLPAIQALYIGGGFPEIFMEALSANRSLRHPRCSRR